MSASFRPAKAFISYAHEDDELRKKLDTQLRILQAQEIIEAWDDRRIKPGTEWEKEIAQELEDAKIILLLVSNAFLSSGYINRAEMKRAMQKHGSGTAIVVPIILHECLWKATEISKLQALPRDNKPVDSEHWSSCDDAFRNVAEELVNLVKGKDPEPPLPPGWEGPYPGLLTFSFEGAPFFFGRQGETDDLVGRLADPNCRFLAVVGASGTGRSSLINAGLCPRLAEGAIEGSAEWKVRRFTPASPVTLPDDNPFVSLAAHVFLTPGGKDKSILLPHYKGSVADLAGELERSPARMSEYVDQALAGSHDTAKLVLFIDQFEELFTKTACGLFFDYQFLQEKGIFSPGFYHNRLFHQDLLSLGWRVHLWLYATLE